MSTSSWGATIEDKTKNVLSFCDSIAGGTLSLPLNAPSEFEAAFDLDGQDATALTTQLASGAVFLRLMEDGTTRFWGQLSDLQADIGENGTLTARFTDLAGVYGNVITYQTGNSVKGVQYEKAYSTSGAQSHNTIVDALLNLGNPIVRLTRSGSVTATRSIVFDGTSVLEALTQLSDFATGIDWYVTPDSTLTIGSSLGSNKSGSVMFQYGGAGFANTLAATVQYQPPRNRLFTINDKGLVNKRPDGSGISSFGSYSAVLQGVPKRAQQSNEDQADQRIRTAWRHILELDVEPTTAPQPWTDYYLGDTVAVNVIRGAYSYSGNQRVNQIQITLDDSMIEVDHKLSFEVI